MFYDAHTHLNQETMYPQWQDYVKQFVASGGKGLVNSGASEFYNLKAIEIAEESKKLFPQLVVKASLGWHPLEVVEGTITEATIEQKIADLRQRCYDAKAHTVAIGETGIDLHYDADPAKLKVQEQLFIKHCDLARELKLPLVVHSRDAFEPTLAILKDYKDLMIYFHCRGYGPEQYTILKEVLPILYIGFCGNITYKKADPLRETLKLVPLTNILMETDAPYLAPQDLRGQTNHPANVKLIYEFTSDYLHIPQLQFQNQIAENFKKVYL